MRAISAFILEAGTSTVLWRAMRPLRSRVSRSAIGSVMLIVLDSSPARLRHPGEGSLQGQVPEADPADLELAQVAAGAPAAPTAGVLPYRELAGGRCLRHPRLGCHRSPRLPATAACGRACPGRRGAHAPPRQSAPWSRCTRSFP